MEQREPSLTTDDGTQIDASDEQSEKAESSMQERIEPELNVNMERDEQSEKQRSQRRLTAAGTRIAASDEQCSKAASSMHASLEPDPNVTG
jgi:hypothetical protein